MKNGIPFDVAFALYDYELMAYGVVFGEFEGGKWNWDDLNWEPDR